MAGERKPLDLPGFDGHRLEVVVEEPKVPEPPQELDCLIDLRPSFNIPDFLVSRFTVTKFEQEGDIFEGTIEGINTSIDKPVVIWWLGEKHGEGEYESRGLVPQYPIVYVDDKPRLTFSDEFDNIALVLALISWFSLEDGNRDVMAPSLQQVRQAILNLS